MYVRTYHVIDSLYELQGPDGFLLKTQSGILPTFTAKHVDCSPIITNYSALEICLADDPEQRETVRHFEPLFWKQL